MHSHPEGECGGEARVAQLRSDTDVPSVHDVMKRNDGKDDRPSFGIMNGMVQPGVNQAKKQRASHAEKENYRPGYRMKRFW